jgi:hypothetical protein
LGENDGEKSAETSMSKDAEPKSQVAEGVSRRGALQKEVQRQLETAVSPALLVGGFAQGSTNRVKDTWLRNARGKQRVVSPHLFEKLRLKFAGKHKA